MTVGTEPSTAARQAYPTGNIIDVDVHANVPRLEALFPFMARLWVDWCLERGWKGPKSVTAHYPPNTERACRSEWRGDGVPASNVAQLAQQCLDAQDLEMAILTCYYGVESIRQPDWAAAMARAVNDWVASEWLDAEPRLRGSIVLPPRDPAAMIAEIRRVAADKRFVQVLLPVRSDTLWGQRHLFPVFEAIEELGLVGTFHYGGVADGTPSTTGHPAWFVEEYSAEWQAFVTQLTSIISEGVLNTFPQLRMAACEGGFLWLPMWGWRMNKEWRGLRREVPWLVEPPFDMIRRHFRFSTSPIEAGSAEHLQQVLSWIGDPKILMYSSDYPHGNEDDLGALLSAIPVDDQVHVMSETARSWYRM